MPQISIVIASFNRRHVLARTLPSLFQQDYAAAAYEVILVVDGSTDGTAQFVRSLEAPCSVEVIERPNRGPAAARNVGIAAAAGDFVLLLDDDIRCTPQLLREHARGHAAESGIRVHGSLFVAPESPRTLAACATHEWYLRYHTELVLARRTNPNWTPYLNANSSAPIELLRDLGGFDETVPFPREDFELTLRIRKSGVRFAYREQALAFEVFQKASRAFVRDAEGFGRAEVIICRKHPSYRSNSVLAPLDRARLALLPTAARRAVSRLPAGAENLFDPAVSAGDKLILRRRARRAGVQLLALQSRVLFARSARNLAGSAARLEAEFDRTLPILLFHRVGYGQAGLHPSLSIDPKAFGSQIAWLYRRGFAGIRLQEWAEWRGGGGILPRKPVLITFDDAYSETAEHAFPVLQRHGFGALVFVPTAAVGRSNSWDHTTDDSRSPLVMDARAIRYWAHHGFDFGAHGRRHRDLTSLTGAELDDEVAGSRADLEDVIGANVRSFAYPFGHHDEASRQAVTESYQFAFTAEPGLNRLRTDPYLTRRTVVSPGDTLFDVEVRARAGRLLLERPRRTLRIRSRSTALYASVTRAATRRSNADASVTTDERHGDNRPRRPKGAIA